MRFIGVNLNKRIEYFTGIDRTFVIYLVTDICLFVDTEFFQGVYLFPLFVVCYVHDVFHWANRMFIV
jgi:hypothetical protein